eukprot:647120-Prymnesium_polylepis.1
MQAQGSPGSHRASSTEDGRRQEAVKQDAIMFITGALALSEKNLSEIMTAMDDVFGLYPDEKLDFDLMREPLGRRAAPARAPRRG